MWDHFTQRAKRVVAGAQEEAANAGSEIVKTEHILLSLCRVPDCVAVNALENLGVNPEQVARDLERTIERQTPALPEKNIAFAPSAKRVLEIAVEEARRFSHTYIGTEHLALGLIKEGQGVAACMLRDLKVDADRMTKEAMKLLRGPGTESDKKTAPSELDCHAAEIAAITELIEAAICRKDYERAAILRECEQRLAAMANTSN